MDWPDLLRLAHRHGVAPLLYHRLTTAGLQPQVPPNIFAALHQSYLRNAARNMRLYHELAQILTILNAHNIPVIVLKGAYLAEAVYGRISAAGNGSFALRTMCDIDLLVHKTDLARSQQLLLQAGYLHHNRRVPIDMHWNIDRSIANLPIDVDAIWQRARTGTVAGVDVRTLAPEDVLLHLCTHIALHHTFQVAGLRALGDIQATIRQDSSVLDWDALIRTAAAWRVTHAVSAALTLGRPPAGSRSSGRRVGTSQATRPATLYPGRADAPDVYGCS